MAFITSHVNWDFKADSLGNKIIRNKHQWWRDWKSSPRKEQHSNSK